MTTNKLKLLLIDDDPDFIRYAKKIISLVPAVTLVKATTDLKKGLSLLLTERIDILLLDMEMPVMNGFELLQQLQHLIFPSDPSIPSLFVIMCSGYDLKAIDCYSNNVSYFLDKPLDYTKLTQAISAFRGRRHPIPLASNLKDEQKKSMLILETKESQTKPIYLKNIVCITVLEKITTLYLKNGEKACYEKPLKEFLAFLPENKFVQISRNSMIAFRYFDHQDGDTVYLKGLETGLLLGGRQAFPRYYEWYDQHYIGRRLS